MQRRKRNYSFDSMDSAGQDFGDYQFGILPTAHTTSVQRTPQSTQYPLLILNHVLHQRFDFKAKALNLFPRENAFDFVVSAERKRAC